MYDLKKKTSPFIPISIYLYTFGFTPSGSSSFNTGICDLFFCFFCGGEVETLGYVRYGIMLHDVVLWDLQTSGYAA